MWTWYADPFGSETPNENPAGGGTFKYNLRFPGQLYDSHAGLIQNYFRDYDPAIGRYVESDPIGLAGGVNAFAYVGSRPISAIDSIGLDALVIIGDRRSGSINVLGHVSIAVTGGGLFSFGTGDRCGGPVLSFLQSQAQARDQLMIRIPATKDQDARMLQYLRQFGSCLSVPVLPDNCAARVESALLAGGVPLEDPAYSGVPAPLPASLVRALLTLAYTGRASGVTVPQGGQVTYDVSQFEHRRVH